MECLGVLSVRRRRASASPSQAIQPAFTLDEFLPICTIIHFFDAHASSSEPVLYLLPQSSVLQGEAPCFVKSLSERICASSPTWQVFAHAPPALPQTSSGWGRDHISAEQICTEKAIDSEVVVVVVSLYECYTVTHKGSFEDF